MAKYKVGDTAFIVESGRAIREVQIMRCTGGLFLIKFTDTGGGIQVKEHRLFSTREAAENSLPKKEPKTHRTPYDWS